ncbi:MAG: CHAT domain-containing protein [Gloeotrichia echinulata GP01]
MARKWSLLFRAVESFLRLTSRILTILWRGWGYSRLVVVMLLGIFILTAGMPVVLSQMTGASQIAQSFGKEQKSGVQDIKSQIQEVKKLQDEGLYYTACKTLIATVLPFYAGLTCDDLDKTYWQEIKNKIDAQNNDTQVIIWFYFGEIMRVIGDLEKSEEALNNGLKVAKNLSSEQQAVIYLSLANTFRAKGNLERDRRSSPVYDYMPWQYVKREEIEEATEYYKKAQENYQIAIDYSSSSIFRFIAQVNLLSLLIEKNQLREAQELSSQIYSQKSNISEIPENLKLKVIYAQINFAKSLAYLNQISEKRDIPTVLYAKKLAYFNQTSEQQDKLVDNPIIKLLTELQKEAKTLNSKTAESYVLGNLGGMYEYLGKLNKAQKATEEALYLAQPSEASDIAYQWQWQMGRLLKQQGKIKEAIASYETAVKTLESVRGDLLAINSDVQFSFRDNVEPLYRELVDLLLIPDGETAPSDINLKKSIYYVDNLQVAELENNLRCSLQKFAPVRININNKNNNPIQTTINEINKFLAYYPQESKAALIYPIILNNKLSIIMIIKDKPIFINLYLINHEKLQDDINNALMNLTKEPFDQNVDKEPLKKLYELLIAPLKQHIEKNKVKNLIFVLDSSLKRIPLAALHDGHQFLVQKDYFISVAPSIQLLKTRNTKEIQLRALIAGGTKELSNQKQISDDMKVEEQIGVEKQIGAVESFFIHPKPKILFKKSGNPFTKSSFKDAIKSSAYNVVHIVAHGRFSSDPKKTVIVTDDNSDIEENYTININEFREIFKSGALRESIELLVLSSCETAQGDNRAVLGIAGIAVRANALGTIAPLWLVGQEYSNEIIKNFYHNLLNENMNKAEALHFAQKSFLDKPDVPSHAPYRWAGFILVGN